MSRSHSDAQAATTQPTQLRKRRSDAGDDLRMRAASPSPFSGQTQSASAAATAPLLSRNPLELRAFGLEDRADAVISSNATDWSLKNLSQWRQEMAQQHSQVAGAADANSKAYIAQRQREFKQQMLRASRAPPPSQ